MSGEAQQGLAPLPLLAGQTLLVIGDLPVNSQIARAARDLGADVLLAGTPSPAAGEDAGLRWLATSAETEDQVDALLDTVGTHVQQLDSVLITVRSSPLAALPELSLDTWRDGVTHPLRRVFWLIRRAVEECLAVGAGTRLVLLLENHVEERGHDVLEEALRSLVRCVAREYGRSGVTCNAVFAVGASPVESVLFLCSTGASFVNGEVLVVAAEDGRRTGGGHGG